MLIRLNRPDIIENIQSRFDARETGKRPSIELDDTIKLVLDVDQLLWYPALQTVVVTPTATGYITLFTVPDGERWRLHNLHVYRSGAGDATYDYSRVSDGGSQIGMTSQTAATSIVYAFTSQPWLEAGMIYQVNVAVWTTGNTAASLLVDVYEGY